MVSQSTKPTSLYHFEVSTPSSGVPTGYGDYSGPVADLQLKTTTTADLTHPIPSLLHINTTSSRQSLPPKITYISFVHASERLRRKRSLTSTTGRTYTTSLFLVLNQPAATDHVDARAPNLTGPSEDNHQLLSKTLLPSQPHIASRRRGQGPQGRWLRRHPVHADPVRGRPCQRRHGPGPGRDPRRPSS